jgi:DNA-binding transcriptional LysR family regulator
VVMGAGERGPGVHALPLYQEPIVLVARAGRAKSRAKLTKKALATLRHVEVHVAPGKGNRALAASYAELGITREIAVIVPTFTAAAAIVAATDLVASLPASLLQVLGPRLGLRALATPLRPIATTIQLLWHERTEHDLALKAFRDLLVRA